MRARQLSLLPALNVSTRLTHGGTLNSGKRKAMRPFDPKRPLHMILRSSQAKGAWNFLHPRHVRRIERLIAEHGEKYGVRIYRHVNVGNHLHLIVQARTRPDFRGFMRALSGAIAVLVTKAKKGVPLQTRFWDQLPYTRVASWGRDFDTLMKYLVKNMFEAAGAWDRKKDPHRRLIWLSFQEAGAGPP